ncbi:MAG: hypothetical protein BWY85_00007 [Firmicutes bacterium ADurb.Bin506]|nr:MAG: hypothetical protein BWY85_00007 [Firmicutes bacterium ADurb.Bin506]
MHASDYLDKRDRIVKAYKRGIVTLENAKLAREMATTPFQYDTVRCVARIAGMTPC